jgi:dihydrodipicolinate synthase/N-acetylneuraminate lyase
LQLAANRVTRTLHSFGFHGALREAMRVLGFECGDPRLPTPPLAADKRQLLREQLDAAGLTEIAAK